ncbi:MAG: tripartite tricarboxylate transporter TctB family protein [Alphaproteobacteria bacterium]|nr:tripartite tricarboxylate transporter TctB family protein [Alphaproteobacteria bacterium]
MSAAPDPNMRREMIEIGVLFVANLVFLFVVVPLGIEDPARFGFGEGLPPSFSADLVGALVAVILGGRFIQLLTGRVDGYRATGSGAGPAEPVEEGQRLQLSLIGMAAAVLFAVILVPVLGFYLGAWFFLFSLLGLLGETRLLHLIVLPPVVVLLVWGMFDRLLSVRLPSGVLFDG